MKDVAIEKGIRGVDARELIKERLVVFDGAMGTMLQKRGLKLGENPEIINFTNEEIVIDIHKEYIRAGADIITTNTFGANEVKLKNTPYSVEAVIKKAVTLAKKASFGEDVLVALDIGPIGELLEPMGTLSFDNAVNIFKRIVRVGEKAGVDLILIETMTDLYEMKAAIIACKEESDLPIFATMTFEEDGRTFTGCLAESMAITLEGLGVDVLGVNCSLGPKELLQIVKRVVSNTNTPVMVQPNAGLPKIVDDETIYDITALEFRERVEEFIKSGVSIVGGCCGTTPKFIEELSKLKKLDILDRENIGMSVLTTPSKVVEVNEVRVVGERINPTGKKLFKEALKKNDLDYIIRQAIEQVEAGAELLDVNVGLPEINEEETIVKIIKEIQSILDIPLQIDSNDPKVIEKALRYYNGKPIVNSVNGDDNILDSILPIVKKYGAAVVGLTLDSNGIPNKAMDRFKIAEKIVDRALEYGIKSEDIYIDPLTLTVSAQQEEVVETLKALKMIKEKLGVKTVLGVSNISFGMPMREMINETFLVMAMEAGLDLPIINPNKESMMGAIRAFKVLKNFDKNGASYIEAYGKNKNIVESKVENIDIESLESCIIKGLKSSTRNITIKLLEAKKELDIVNEDLIPALDKVGKKYESGEIFLPQLIQAAETVKVAFDIIKERLVLNDKESSVGKGKIILATVQGDIHDIGKNIVKVILENYGYDIIDLGKDVRVGKVVEEALKNDVKLVGLSALMTTTIKSMEKTIRELKNDGFKGYVMVGGAVVTEEYAQKIGADYYAKDANDSVKIAKEVFNRGII